MQYRTRQITFYVLAVLAACGLSLLTGCGGVNPTSSYSSSSGLPDWALDQGGISGKVTIGSSTTAIAGALIEAAQAQAISDADGIFLMGPLPQGEYRVIIRAAGYSPQVRTGVRVRSGLITDSINFQMSVETASASRDFAIVSLAPNFGTDGDEISILGTGFGTIPGKVTIAGKDASIMDWNSKRDGIIRVRLPSEVETGVVRVFINGEGSHEASPVTFTGRPVALEVRPSGARPGQQVTIYGRNFHEVPAFNKVTLNGLTCTVLPESNTRQLVILVPSNAQTGLLNVSLQSNQIQLDGLSYATLTVPPELIYLTPQRSIPDVTLTLYGKGFGYDVNAVSIKLGDRKRLGPNDFLSFSNNKITFKAPDSTVIPPGETVDVWLYVNNIPCLTPLKYTAYNPALETLETGKYGIFRFADKSSGNTLRLSKLAENERLAFLVSMCGDGSSNLDGSFPYAITARLGGNNTEVPALPTANLTSSLKSLPNLTSRKSYRDVGPMVRSWNPPRSSSSPIRPQIRASLDADAPASTTFWLVNFASTNPSDPANDELATATLFATGTHCLVYVDNATDTAFTASNAERIAGWFDGIYATLATACSDGLTSPPEGNVDAQSRIVLFVTPQINRGVSDGLVTLGYFNPRDKNLAATNSNGTEILYFWDQAFKDPENFRGVMAHELQHMMYYTQKGINGSTWIDEGLSVWAQQIVGEGFPQGRSAPVSQVGAYLKAPNTVSLNHWQDNSLANYGMSYLFVQYLFERCGQYGAIQKLERNIGLSGFPDVANVLVDATSTTQLKPFLQDEFGLAMYCDGLSLPTALNGYLPAVHQYTGFELRKGISGINGLSHLSLNENPVTNEALTMQGYGFDVVEYARGNGGDVEFTLVSSPGPDFHVWVLYYQNSD